MVDGLDWRPRANYEEPKRLPDGDSAVQACEERTMKMAQLKHWGAALSLVVLQTAVKA